MLLPIIALAIIQGTGTIAAAGKGEVMLQGTGTVTVAGVGDLAYKGDIANVVVDGSGKKIIKGEWTILRGEGRVTVTSAKNGTIAVGLRGSGGIIAKGSGWVKLSGDGFWDILP